MSVIRYETRNNPDIGDKIEIIYWGGYHASPSLAREHFGFYNYKETNRAHQFCMRGRVIGKTTLPSQKLIYGIECDDGAKLVFSNACKQECFKILKPKNYLPEDLFTL